MDYMAWDDQKLNKELEVFSTEEDPNPFSIISFSTLGAGSLDHKVLVACCSSLFVYLSLQPSQFPEVKLP